MVFDVFRAGYDFGAKPEISEDLTILDSAWFTITKIQLAYLPLKWSLMFLALTIISVQNLKFLKNKILDLSQAPLN